MPLRMELQKRIDQSAAEYEQYRRDPYQSHVYAAKKEQLEAIGQQLQEDRPEAVLSRLLERLPQMESDLEREQHCPSFDWYNEHYHELVLTGRLEAMQEAIGLLKEYLEGKN